MFLFGTEVYTELFTILMLDCVIHNFWIPIFIIHHFLCKHHYSLYCLHHRMKEKWECKIFKSTDDQFFFAKALLRETEQPEIYCDDSLEGDMGIYVVAAVSLICFVWRCGD